MRIALLNDCWRTPISAVPDNWNTQKASTKKDWYIWYRFYDPKFKDKWPNGRTIKFAGMNSYKNLRDRQARTKILLDEEVHQVMPFVTTPIPSFT